MTDDFPQMIQRIMAGDAEAAAKLVNDYAPQIRRIIRFRLRDPHLRRIVDTMDICQSVFGKFFVQASLGRFQLNQPEDLVRLLARMATNRVIDRYRTEQSQRNLRLAHCQERDFDALGQQVDYSQIPASVVEQQEILRTVQERLTDHERQISDLRRQGMSWLEVARTLGESPQALRKRLERACERVFEDLGIVAP